MDLFLKINILIYFIFYVLLYNGLEKKKTFLK